ncbi:MAG: ParB/RepB/Spo0J family partition protein [Hyphomonas sp.]|nr:ParB/RepB/Spo0J family partition protein [Hyphomonas sp.]
MTKSKKITLSASRDIPFNKLVLSQANVRHIKVGVSIEELAEDIARRTLLASLTVRPVLDEDSVETGMFEVPGGGRCFRALELPVKKRRLNRTAPVPCIVRTEGLAEEDSLAENIQRAPLHPLDQFRAFQAMREKGKSEEEIAAAFFVSINVVKQRLKLASVSESLLAAYADEKMTLEQLMAFTVNPDHARQEQVWEALKQHYNKQLPPGRACETKMRTILSLLRYSEAIPKREIMALNRSQQRQSQNYPFRSMNCGVFRTRCCSTHDNCGASAVS